MAKKTATEKQTPALDTFIASLKFDRVDFLGIAGHAVPKKPRVVDSPNNDTTSTIEEPQNPVDQEALDADGNPAETQEWGVHVKVSPKSINLRTRIETNSPTAQYTVDAAIIYNRIGDYHDKPPGEYVAHFISRIAFPGLLPFLREAMFDTSRRLHLPPPDLPSAVTPEEIVDGLTRAAKTGVATSKNH